MHIALWLGVALYLCVSLLLWFVYFRGYLVNHLGFVGYAFTPAASVVAVFLEHLKFHLPGGKARRVEFVKQMVSDFDGDPNGELRTHKRIWKTGEITEHDAYEQFAEEFFSSDLRFWINFVLSPLLWLPLLILGSVLLALKNSK